MKVDHSRAYKVGARLAEGGLSRQSNLNDALTVDLIAKVRPILHSECRELETKPPKALTANKPPPCDFHDYCFCCDNGTQTWQMRCRFYVSLKLHITSVEDRKDMLIARMILVCLRGIREELHGLEKAFALELGRPTEHFDQEVWLHIGNHSFNPFSRLSESWSEIRRCIASLDRRLA